MFSAAKANERATERELDLFPLQKIALSDVILARTICVPVACVVAGTCVVAGCQSMSKQTNNRKKSDKGRTIRKLMGGGRGRAKYKKNIRAREN